MVVDPRRDHSLRVPRPDLSVKLGTPNACNACHEDQTPQWAARAVQEWYGRDSGEAWHYGLALDAGRNHAATAEQQLARVLDDSTLAPIVRATAADLLRTNLGARGLGALDRALGDTSALVRLAAVGALEFVEPQARLQHGRALLEDEVRAVRLEAASVLSSTPPEMLSDADQRLLDRAIAEYRVSQRMNEDRAEAHYNLGVLEDRQGFLEAAEASYRSSLRRDSTFTASYVNLADVYRKQGRDAQGVRLLRSGLHAVPHDGDLRHALGLALVRSGQKDAALLELQRAAELRPDRPRYAYVFAIALHSAGQTSRAVSILRSTHERHPADRQTLLGLATLSRDAGDSRAALDWAEKLLALDPGDERLRAWVEQVRSEHK